MTIASVDRGFDRLSTSWRSPTALMRADAGCDFLKGVRQQLRKDYSEVLETSLPEELASLISELDQAP